jgi:multidrug efflux pump subunit AcrA (membrane-fusion protein)
MIPRQVPVNAVVARTNLPSFQVVAPAEGKVTRLLVRPGHSVQVGDELAAVESPVLAEAQATYLATTRLLNAAQKHRERLQELAGTAESTPEKVEEARKAELAAVAEIEAAQAEVATARKAVSDARAAIETRVADRATAGAAAARASSAVVQAEAQVTVAQAARVQAKIRVATAHSRCARLKQLAARGLAARQECEEAQADYQRALADTQAAQANLLPAEAQVEAARIGDEVARQSAVAAAERVNESHANLEAAEARQAQLEAKLTVATQLGQIARQAKETEEAVTQGGRVTPENLAAAEALVQQVSQKQQAAVETIRVHSGTPGGGSEIPIVAAVAGQVAEQKMSEGQLVMAGQPLLAIQSPAAALVLLSAPVEAAGVIRPGQKVQLVTESRPGHPLTGVVSAAGERGADRTTAPAVVPIGVAGLSANTLLRGSVTTGETVPVVSIPAAAVQEFREGQTVVFVQGARPDEFIVREVELGENSDGKVTIQSGLAAGERIVTEGTAFIASAVNTPPGTVPDAGDR